MRNNLPYLKKLRLVNYCAYEDQTFNFLKEDGSPYKFVCFFGPNGSGKSTLLEAISMLTMNTTGRTDEHIKESLKKYIRNVDYNPGLESVKNRSYEKGFVTGFKNKSTDLLIEGTYTINEKDYVVQLTQNGYIRNDLAPVTSDKDDAVQYTNSGLWESNHLAYRQRMAHFVTSDSDLSFYKFQLHYSQMEHFESIISEIMRYKADCIVPSNYTEMSNGFCTDFVITKKGHRIHFKRMSAGEKKICKSFSDLLNLMYDLSNPSPGEMLMDGWPRLLLIDNVELHVYYDRHITLIECLKRVFERQQIFATTHSGILIQRQLNNENDKDNELWINLEELNC